jgi:lysophospholipase L1-like esterase
MTNKEGLITVSTKGFGLDYTANIKNDFEKTAKSAILRHTYKDWIHLDYNKIIINNIIAYCKTKKIKLVFVTLPAYYTYINKLDNRQINETIKYMESIAKEYDNVYYFNFLEDESFDNSDFFDADHLNESGAEKITKKLDQIIIKIENENILLNNAYKLSDSNINMLYKVGEK